MIDVTKETMQQHFTAYDKFKGQIETIEQQANEAIKTLSFYEPPNSGVLKGNSSRQLDRIIEGDKEAEAVGRKEQKVSQEESKTNIVNTLVNMNQTMKEFSNDLESRLDRVYKKGASKKFGYDSIASAS